MALDDSGRTWLVQRFHEVSNARDLAGQVLMVCIHSSIGPFEKPIEYSPSDKATLDHDLAIAKRMLQPHTLLTQVLSSRFQAVKYRDRGITLAFFRLLTRSFRAHRRMR